MFSCNYLTWFYISPFVQVKFTIFKIRPNHKWLPLHIIYCAPYLVLCNFWNLLTPSKTVHQRLKYWHTWLCLDAWIFGVNGLPRAIVRPFHWTSATQEKNKRVLPGKLTLPVVYVETYNGWFTFQNHFYHSRNNKTINHSKNLRGSLISNSVLL